MDIFFDNVATIIEQALAHVGRTADLAMCVTYFEVGRLIVEQEQKGKPRAGYRLKSLKELSKYLNARFGKGFSETNLKNARQFYQVYAPAIRQTLSDELEEGVQKKGKRQTLSDESGSRKQQTLSVKSKKDLLSAKISGSPPKNQLSIGISLPFRLSWSHYQVLMRIKNDNERRFYEIEAVNQQWSLADLKRQYNSSLYERLALSRDKAGVMRLAKEGRNEREVQTCGILLQRLLLDRSSN